MTDKPADTWSEEAVEAAGVAVAKKTDCDRFARYPSCLGNGLCSRTESLLMCPCREAGRAALSAATSVLLKDREGLVGDVEKWAQRCSSEGPGSLGDTLRQAALALAAVGQESASERFKSMSPDEKKAFIAYLWEGFCPHCGFPDPENRCQCWNDE